MGSSTCRTISVSLTPEIMFRQPHLIAAASLGNELVWAISTCIHFADRLSRFNLRRDAFEKNLLKNKQDETNFELELIQKEASFEIRVGNVGYRPGK
jgi:hypothetical protein